MNFIQPKLLCSCFVLCAALSVSFPGRASSPLSISNQTDQNILNIFARPFNGKKDFFLRLDLEAGASDKVENPDCEAGLRVDTGLEFWFFDKVDLGAVKRMIFCGEHQVCLILEPRNNNAPIHMRGRMQSLLPDGGRPVCELTRFRPRMPMKEVCAILERDAPRDDSDAILAGLGFAGMLWAARLSPAQSGGDVSADSLLEHLELRKRLEENDPEKVLHALFSQGYTPWQAEFPGLDIDFADMTGQDEAARKRLLLEAIARFMKSEKNGSRRHSDSGCEASIMMAPASILHALSNSDAPVADVQLFTIILRPDSRILLLDVAAYQGEAGK